MHRVEGSLESSGLALGVTRLELARVHWRVGSIRLASGSNRSP